MSCFSWRDCHEDWKAIKQRLKEEEEDRLRDEEEERALNGQDFDSSSPPPSPKQPPPLRSLGKPAVAIEIEVDQAVKGLQDTTI